MPKLVIWNLRKPRLRFSSYREHGSSRGLTWRSCGFCDSLTSTRSNWGSGCNKESHREDQIRTGRVSGTVPRFHIAAAGRGAHRSTKSHADADLRRGHEEGRVHARIARLREK